MTVEDQPVCPVCGETHDADVRERPAQVRATIDRLLVRWTQTDMGDVRLEHAERWALIDFLEAVTRLDEASKTRLGCGVREAFDRSRARAAEESASC